MRLRHSAFTLVELLVVIGIIALLISILLPALQTARRQAQQVKCGAHLREIGAAFQMYAHENQGYYPVAQYRGRAYEIDGFTYNAAAGPNSSSVAAYWPSFLARYVAAGRQGVAATDGDLAHSARDSVLWGCPSWPGYTSATIGGINRIQNGLGMNLWPTFTATHPPTANFPPTAERAWIDAAPNPQQGNFIKQVNWRSASERALVADSRFWAAESNPPRADGTFPPQPNFNNVQTYSLPNQTMVDVYRHGVPPPGNGPNAFTYAETGGKVAYNILYADGHVALNRDQREAYFAFRQRFPG